MACPRPLYMSIGPLLLLCIVCSAAESSPSRVDAKTDQGFLDDLLEYMDPLLLPEAPEGGPIRVECGLYIMSFSEVSEISMDYEVTVLFRTSWNDTRLIHKNPQGHPFVSLASNDSQIWIPDVVFENDKDAVNHQVTVPNKLTKIYTSGKVLQSARITLTLACPMNLVAFPMDTQKCPMKLQSFGYSHDQLELDWMEEPVAFDQEMEMPQFDLGDTIAELPFTKQYNTTGRVSALRVDFTLHRQFGFFVLQTYLPSVMIVILSWVSFWISRDAIPARITLSLTTFLTMTTQMTASSARTPKVSYPKAIDVWLNVCMLFVFASLIEFAFVNDLSRKYVKILLKRQKIDDTNGGRTPGSLGEVDSPAPVRTRNGYNREDSGRMLDKTSRVVFPLAFLAFNIVYWPFYIRYIHEFMLD